MWALLAPYVAAGRSGRPKNTPWRPGWRGVARDRVAVLTTPPYLRCHVQRDGAPETRGQPGETTRQGRPWRGPQGQGDQQDGALRRIRATDKRDVGARPAPGRGYEAADQGGVSWAGCGDGLVLGFLLSAGAETWDQCPTNVELGGGILRDAILAGQCPSQCLGNSPICSAQGKNKKRMVSCHGRLLM